MIREIEKKAANGISALLILVVVTLVLVWSLLVGIATENAVRIVGSVLALPFVTFLYFGLFVVNPNEARVLQLFGSYIGTVTDPGLRWANPFYTKKRVSLRVSNFETSKMKVNDNRGNPVEIAAVVVWKVVDTAEAIFEVDDYVHYVHVQSEAAVRNLATNYPYDSFEDDEVSMVGHIGEIDLPAAAGRESGPAHQGWRQDHRVAHLAPGVLARDRPGDASPAAGDRDHRGAPQDRRRRRRHGRARAPGIVVQENPRARPGAQGKHGFELADRAVQRIGDAAGDQHRLPLHVVLRPTNRPRTLGSPRTGLVSTCGQA